MYRCERRSNHWRLGLCIQQRHTIGLLALQIPIPIVAMAAVPRQGTKGLSSSCWLGHTCTDHLGRLQPDPTVSIRFRFEYCNMLKLKFAFKIVLQVLLPRTPRHVHMSKNRKQSRTPKLRAHCSAQRVIFSNNNNFLNLGSDQVIYPKVATVYAISMHPNADHQTRFNEIEIFCR